MSDNNTQIQSFELSDSDLDNVAGGCGYGYGHGGHKDHKPYDDGHKKDYKCEPKHDPYPKKCGGGSGYYVKFGSYTY